MSALSNRVFCQEQRTQAQNKERAFSILRAKLFELELQKQQDEIYAARKGQVGTWKCWMVQGVLSVNHVT